MDLVNLDFVKLWPNIKTPTKATQFCPKDYLLIPWGQLVIPTGLKIKVPCEHYGHLCSGIVDPDYAGEIKVCLQNLGTEPFQILAGNAIAQLILGKISIPILHKVDTLSSIDRGNRGCGFSKYNTLSTKLKKFVHISYILLPNLK